MSVLSKAKWLTATGGIIGLASFLALGLSVPGKQAARIGGLRQPGLLRPASAPIFAVASSNKVNVAKHYGQLPLAFEPALPGSNKEVKFLARGNGYALFLENHDAVLELRGDSKTSGLVRMQLAGANPAPDFTALEQLPGKSNYFIGNRPEDWHTNIPQYRKVLERNVYRGVNLVYYGTQGQLEYDFDVAPGADPSVIHLAFQGARDVRIDAQGELRVNTSAGEVRLRKPVAYQEIAGSKQPVPVGYVLKNNSVAFQVAEYDPRSPLVIDPILIYSTYLGGNNIDTSNSIAVAPDNTAFIAGATFSADFPTAHPLQANDGGNPDFPQDAFVAKISADGSTLLYSTYLGGENQDAANGIAVDSFGDAFVVGYTLSPGFPVLPGSFETLCGGDGKCGAKFTGGPIVSNGFVTKLNPAGSGILYSTFYGQFQNVKGQAIAVDSNGNAYITGTTSANFASFAIFPITPTAFQSAFCNSCANPGNASVNAFVGVLDATGTSALYSSYLGGEIEDVGYGIAVDKNANAYVTGLTYSATNFPVTAGALQSTYGGSGDAFVAKVNTVGSGAASLVFATYLGGAGLDQGNAITLDSAGNPYVAGLTNSAAFGFTPAGTFQTTYAGQGDAFVTKLTTAGALTYFTYLGGTHADSATGIAVDSTNNVYVTGTTASVDFPTAGAVFQPAYGGGNTDSFVAKLNSAGAALVYSSYLGGTNAELATGIAVDTSGSAYITGQTCSNDFPLANPLQAVPGGNCDAYIAKVSILDGFSLNPGGLIFSAQSLNTTSQSQTITVTNGDTAQTISNISISGNNPGDFAQTNTCGPSLIVGATCTITVSFTPTGQGIRKASLIITDSAPGSPQVVNLTGNTSTVSLSASSLSFGSQAVGTVSSPQDVTVTNSGTTPLTFSSITASGDFFAADTCLRAPLQPGSNCVIQVEFVPSSAIGSVGSIAIADNGSGSPQVILATGTGILEPPFQISTLSAPPSVSAGKTAQYILSVTSPVGFNQPVGLSCSAPATITCTVSPSVVTPTAAQTPATLLTISTALRTAVPPSTGIKIDPLNLLRQFGRTWLILLAVALMILTVAGLRRRPISAAFGFAVVLLLAAVACGGGPSGVPSGTPAGTYQITVTGTSGSVNVPATVTLKVN